jgi:hypothetical protein
MWTDFVGEPHERRTPMARSPMARPEDAAADDEADAPDAPLAGVVWLEHGEDALTNEPLVRMAPRRNRPDL